MSHKDVAFTSASAATAAVCIDGTSIAKSCQDVSRCQPRCDDMPVAIVTPDNVTDVHYFDVLHPVMLSHVRRANSDGVLALLALPEIAENPLFWRTCTYREGLVATVLMHVVAHTGQACVPAYSSSLARKSYKGFEKSSDSGYATNCFEEATRSSERPSSSSPPSNAASPNKGTWVDPEMHAVCSSDGSTSHAILTVTELQALLHFCGPHAAVASSTGELLHTPVLRDGATGKGDDADASFSLYRPRGLVALLRAAVDFRQHCSRCRGDSSTPGRSAHQQQRHRQRLPQQNARLAEEYSDLMQYVESVMRVLTTLRSADRSCEAADQTAAARPSSSVPTTPPRKRLRLTNVLDAVADWGAEEEDYPRTRDQGGPPKNEVARSSQPLQHPGAPRSSPDTPAAVTAVDLASLAAVLQEKCCSMVYVNPYSPNGARSTDGRLDGADNAHTHGAAAAAAPAGELIPTPISTDLKRQVDVFGKTATRDSVRGDAEALGDLYDAEASTNQGKEEGELDAVALLSHVPAISATRWSVPISNPDDEARQTTRMVQVHAARTSFPPLSVAASAHAERRFPTRSSASSSAALAAVASLSTTQPREQQIRAEQGRVSAAIRAFDAFSAALVQSSTALGAISNPSLPATSSFTTTTTSTSSVAPASLLLARRSTADMAATCFEQGTAASLPPQPQADVQCARQRRHRFSPEEDAAILQGVARFGQRTGAFRSIHHAYRHVWRTGRTAQHLSYHWRDVLRQRAINSAAADISGAGGEMVAMGTQRMPPPSSDNEPELSSDIENFSDDAQE